MPLNEALLSACRKKRDEVKSMGQDYRHYYIADLPIIYKNALFIILSFRKNAKKEQLF